MDQKTKKKAGTFTLNKKEPFHNWYSYVEGYSSCLVEDELNALKGENIKSVYDPFGGTGTTPLVAVQHGLEAYYSEINPFMLGVIDAKINGVKTLCSSKKGTTDLREFLHWLQHEEITQKNEIIAWNGFEKYFEPQVLHKVLSIKKKISTIEDCASRKILMLALSSVLVRCSKMIRRGDLRYATSKEKDEADFDVVSLLTEKIQSIISDIENCGGMIGKPAQLVSPDSRDIFAVDDYDCVITSPPYLNGTNYIRNTKLELKLNDHVESEADLPKFHSQGIIAGINNVSKRKGDIPVLPEIREIIDNLKPVVYDDRITMMVAGYFYDMNTVIKKLSIAIRLNGFFIMDIGDSVFAGIHIPTHEILSILCENNGFEKYGETILRTRHSKNGTELSQRILRFRLRRKDYGIDTRRIIADSFLKSLPYKEGEYSGRNWGHSWHSLCSYHGKLKPAISYYLVKSFTSDGDVVLDPLCGVGTIPFEACLQGRIGIGNDLSEMAYIVTKAKLEKPDLKDVEVVLSDLSKYIETSKNSTTISKQIKKYESFGFNGKLPSYFHKETFREILSARNYLVPRIQSLTAAEAMVYSAFLHVLHGNRPYALSRNSHPLTPYSPKGDFIYKNVIEHIRNKVEIAYKEEAFESYVKGKAILGDYSELPNLDGKVDAIITSPPFADSIRFYMQNWMRLWLCGWEDSDFKKADDIFLDSKQKRDFSVYKSFFSMCYRVLKNKGILILHLGKTEKINMAEELTQWYSPFFSLIREGQESVEKIEKHGVKDKGATVAHQFVFLQKN